MNNQTSDIHDNKLSNIRLDFIEYLKQTPPKRNGRTKSYSDFTIKEYEYDIGIFLQFVGSALGKKDLNEITYEHFIEYKNSLIKRMSKTTANRKIASAKTFFKFLKRTNVIKHNCASEVETFEIEQQKRKSLTSEQLNDLLNTFVNSKMKFAFRNYVIFCLLTVTGMRVGELVALNCDDINFSTREILVKGIEDADRNIPFTLETEKILRKYMVFRNNIKNNKIKLTNALFVSERYKRISVKTIHHHMKKHIEEAGINPKEFSTHSLRHTFTTLSFKNNDISTILLSKILGVSSATLPIYLHTDTSDIQKELNKFLSSPILENCDA